MPTSTSPPAAHATALTKVYGEGDTQVVALDRLTVEFARGALTAIMGASGSGKSTLMHCMSGLDTVTSGSAYVGEVELTRLGDKQLTRLRRDTIGFVFQAFNLLPTLTAIENIMLPLTLAGRRADPDWLATVVGALGLADRLAHRPAQLSGGQQQRVAIARALAARPEVIFADEPTGNLDSRSGGEVLGLLRHTVDALGQTIVMVTHDAVAAAQANRVVFLADGRVVDEVRAPTVESVLTRVKALDATRGN